jgi:hypothetical protein
MKCFQIATADHNVHECAAAAFLTPPHFSTFSFEYVPARAKSKMNSTTPPTLKKATTKYNHSRRLLVTHMNVNITTVLLNT